jgi:Domain of unknown function (DUF929)
MALVCFAFLASAASAAASSVPLGSLKRAQQQLRTLTTNAHSPGDRKRLAKAYVYVTGATFPPLWIDAKDAVAPGYGTLVFAYSRAALATLQPLATSGGPSPALLASEKLILGADRGLAQRVIQDAAEGAGLLVRAQGMVRSGDRWAAASRFALAAEQYGVAWLDAFAALTPLVVTAATNVPAGPLGDAAENALGSTRVSLAAVDFLKNQPPLTANGKPEVLFIGAEACPYCAAERWGMVVALSQFGTFSNLQLIQSATTEHPIVRSFTFHGSGYQSPYISFVPVELTSNVVGRGGRYQRLQQLTPAQNALFTELAPSQTVPVVDVANQTANVGSTVSPTLTGGLSWRQLASSLKRPNSVSGQAIAGMAEVLTAEICQATGGAPASVCGSAVVQDYEAALPRLDGRGGGCPATPAAAPADDRAVGRGYNPVATAARCHGH